MLFGIMAVGYVCGKCGVLDETANAKFSGFLLKVALPATIINSALSQSSIDLGIVWQVTVTAVGIFLFLSVISRQIARIFHLEATYQLMLNYSNLGFMGLPIISSVYGEDSAFFVAIFMMVFNIHIFTFGIITLQGKAENLRSMAKQLCTPGILSAVLAFGIVVFHLKIPAPASRILGSLGSVTTPLAMVVIGSQLAGVKLGTVLTNPSLYLMTVVKLAVYPAVVYGVLRILMGPGLIAEIAAILMGLPVAGNVTMLCSEYDGNVSLAAQGTCLSTLLSLITIPFLLSAF